MQQDRANSWLCTSLLCTPHTVLLLLSTIHTVQSKLEKNMCNEEQDNTKKIYRMNHILCLVAQEPHDSVFVTVGPLSHYDYKYPIISNHPAGGFVYHPHRHGSVWFQVRYLLWYNKAVLHFRSLRHYWFSCENGFVFTMQERYFDININWNKVARSCQYKNKQCNKKCWDKYNNTHLSKPEVEVRVELTMRD